MAHKKHFILICLVISFVSSASLSAREYGEVMSIHSGNADANGAATFECFVKIKKETNNTITSWLQVVSGTNRYLPNGCAILLSAYVSDKRIGYDLSGSQFINVCLADKMDC